MLRALQHRRSALAVALPSTERQLHSQAEHDKRVAKLVDRLARLMVQLDLSAPLSEDSAEYQRGLAALRDEQLRHLQQQIEREVAALGELTQGRKQLGAASAQTRNQDRRARRRRKRIRQLVDTMQTWQQKDLPQSAVTQALPAVWTEHAIKQLFAGCFPWHQASGGAGRLPVLLVERFRDACAEVSGCRVTVGYKLLVFVTACAPACRSQQSCLGRCWLSGTTCPTDTRLSVNRRDHLFLVYAETPGHCSLVSNSSLLTSCLSMFHVATGGAHS